MQVFIMRHGEAAMHAASDAERALTNSGRQHSEQAAQWLKSQFAGLNIACIDYALVSPYLRAQQTLNTALNILNIDHIETIPELTPSGNEERVADYLWALAGKDVNAVLVVSHLPLVGYLVTELCPDVHPPMFATSAIVAITLDPAHRQSTLQWQYHP